MTRGSCAFLSSHVDVPLQSHPIPTANVNMIVAFFFFRACRRHDRTRHRVARVHASRLLWHTMEYAVYLMLSLHSNFLNYVNDVMDLLMVSQRDCATYVRRRLDHTIITGARFYYSNDCVRCQASASHTRSGIQFRATSPLMRGSILHVQCV